MANTHWYITANIVQVGHFASWRIYRFVPDHVWCFHFIPTQFTPCVPMDVCRFVPVHVGRSVPGRVGRFVPGHVGQSVPGRVGRFVPCHVYPFCAIGSFFRIKKFPDMKSITIINNCIRSIIYFFLNLSCPRSLWNNQWQSRLLSSRGIKATKAQRKRILLWTNRYNLWQWICSTCSFNSMN